MNFEFDIVRSERVKQYFLQHLLLEQNELIYNVYKEKKIPSHVTIEQNVH